MQSVKIVLMIAVVKIIASMNWWRRINAKLEKR